MTMTLLHLADDMVHRILFFLDATSLAQCRLMCTKVRILVDGHVRLRVTEQQQLQLLQRFLTTPLLLLRAREQAGGEYDNYCYHHGLPLLKCVPIPTLLLRRRLVVAHAGDDDFNGLYHCTAANGNGYVFTKPRKRSNKNLRCIIAKRFSNEVSATSSSPMIFGFELSAQSFITLDAFVVHEQRNQ
jgi:hypothetical protein